MVLPRYRSQWPPPGLVEEPVAREHTHLGAPLDPVPQLVVGGKAVTAATIRCGPNYIEVCVEGGGVFVEGGGARSVASCDR